jgi:hypothetical protein
MIDEHRLNLDIARRARAEALLQNELLQEAFFKLEDRYIEEWRATGLRDSDARERLWKAVDVVRKVKDHLGTIVSDGKLAQRELDELTRRRKLLGLI